jgi:hypothetical protein
MSNLFLWVGMSKLQSQYHIPKIPTRFWAQRIKTFYWITTIPQKKIVRCRVNMELVRAWTKIRINTYWLLLYTIVYYRVIRKQTNQTKETMITHFNNEVVEDFLIDINEPYAAKCWKEDSLSNIESRTEYIQTCEWFRRHFPSNKNQLVFSMLKNHIINHHLIWWLFDSSRIFNT